MVIPFIFPNRITYTHTRALASMTSSFRKREKKISVAKMWTLSPIYVKRTLFAPINANSRHNNTKETWTENEKSV